MIDRIVLHQAATMQLPWHHIHITIPDRGNAARWYADAGLVRIGTPTKRSENLWFTENLVQLQSEDVAVTSDSRFHSVGIEVSDIESTLTELEARGATVIERGPESALLTDPFGTCIEVVAGTAGRQSHLNIVVDDPITCARWYASMLGGEPAMCPWDVSRSAVRWNTEMICFMDRSVAPLDRCIDHIGWYTPDLDGTFERLTNADVRFPVPPRPFGSVNIAFLEDPGGIWIELVESSGNRSIS